MRFLHTRFRVSDLEKSIAFYEKLDFILTERKISPAGNKLAYLKASESDCLLELCWSPDFPIQIPEDVIHICVGVADVYAYCEQLEEKGLELWPEDWRLSFKEGGALMGFVTDPDGYEIEILPA